MTASSSEVKTTYWLEMNRPDALRPSQSDGGLDIHRVEIPCPEYNWFLHQVVGGDYRWGGREHWGPRQWTEYVDRPRLETWVAYLRGTPAGYFELEGQDDGSVRIVCFGLRAPFIGQGLGGPLLTACIARAWKMGASRVWLTTCSHDHPSALPAYLARGFELFNETTGPPNQPHRSALFGG